LSTPQNCNVRTNLCNEEDHAPVFDSRNDQNDREYQKIEGRNIDLEKKRDIKHKVSTLFTHFVHFIE